MKKIISTWILGWHYLFSDEGLNSFYTFFTVIFAECAYVWAFCESHEALLLTIVFMGYIITVIETAWLKGKYEGTKLEVCFAFYYVVVFILWFVVGCIINYKIMLIMSVIALGATGICIFLGTYAIYVLPIISLIIRIGGPFIAFTVCLSKVAVLPTVFKVIIPVAYLLCIPFIAVYEDESSALNIFELAYKISWSKEREDNK